jgi:uncharacterized membrane-anchored protein
VIPLPAFSWKLVAKIAAVLAVLLVLWWVQSRIRVSYQAEAERDAISATHAAYKAMAQAMAAAAAKRMEADAAADKAHTARVDVLNTENEGLRRLLAGTPATVESSDANGNRRVAINPCWWLRVSGFVTRDPASTAPCEAGSSAGGLPSTVSR